MNITIQIVGDLMFIENKNLNIIINKNYLFSAIKYENAIVGIKVCYPGMQSSTYELACTIEEFWEAYRLAYFDKK